METTNQKTCQCENRSCGCAAVKVERCACGDGCACKATCQCNPGCGCAPAK